MPENLFAEMLLVPTALQKGSGEAGQSPTWAATGCALGALGLVRLVLGARPPSEVDSVRSSSVLQLRCFLQMDSQGVQDLIVSGSLLVAMVGIDIQHVVE